jgi:hypothetical protein
VQRSVPGSASSCAWARPAQATATATCPSTSVLVAGGYTSNNTNASLFDLYQSFPSTPGLRGTWTVTIGSSSALTFTPYALCAP